MVPDKLESDPDFFVQMLCHEYCHGLFLRAFFKAHGDGKPDYSEKNKDIEGVLKTLELAESEYWPSGSPLRIDPRSQHWFVAMSTSRQASL